MTSTTSSTVHPSTASASQRTRLLAVAGFVASAICTGVGTFWDLTDNESGSEHDLNEWLIVLGITAVTVAIVFGLVVRTAAAGNPSRRAAILGVVAFLSVAFFWAGMPMVIAAGVLACALVDRDRLGSFGTGSKVGLALSALTTVACVVLAIAG